MNKLKVNSHFCEIKTGNINYKESTIKSLLAINKNGNFCQIVPAQTVCSFLQAFVALEQTLDAQSNNTSFSEKPQLEFLIRLYGTKQINAALDRAELKTGKNMALLICAHKSRQKLNALFSKAQKELEFAGQKFQLGANKKELMKLYRVSNAQLQSMKGEKNALEKLIIEKNSLVVFQT
ncbi:MAG: KEOPS complex subunit Cgi121 [archaeon]